MEYTQFLQSKVTNHIGEGIVINPEKVHSKLFNFQRDIVVWALKKGKSAVFLDCGLGKTFVQLEWARLLNKDVLVVAPLSVARQTKKMGLDIGLDITFARKQSDCKSGINITNYEMIEHFDPSKFEGVVLDESSILKSITGVTRSKLIEMFGDTPYKLCCTATPAPNDIAEIANHSEFLGIKSRVDMLATFFVHDDEGWRLKGHAIDPFYKWLASWSISMQKPSDLGYDNFGFNLPELKIEPIIVQTGYKRDDMLFWTELKGITDRSAVRRDTLCDRCTVAAEMVNADKDQWLIWCGLNDEANLLKDLIPDSINIQGDMDIEDKIDGIEGFQDGRYRVLITKPKVAGHGMNFQNAHKMAFVGLSDSYEAYYQCIRREWRFGQCNPVKVYIVLSEVEQEIYQNVLNKEKEARLMQEKLIQNVKTHEQDELRSKSMDFKYETDTFKTDDYTLMLGDSVERMKELPDNSVDLSVYSPPFLSLYTYSPSERDIGNSEKPEVFFEHLGYIIKELLRVTKPGRNTCCHVSQVPAMLVRDGYIGLKDFRGQTVMAFEKHGWTFHGEVVIDKDPQVQAIRTHSKGLLFTQLKKDASWLRPALCDYILVFRKPGDNAVDIKPDLTNDEWIEYARPIWYGIRETETLNAAEGTQNEDERHICPLQLGTIERCIRLWSNEGETVFSPFMGIGSEGYKAVSLGRKFVGIDLKKSYYQTAIKNLSRSVAKKNQVDLFSYVNKEE
jgi:DNA modification methylase